MNPDFISRGFGPDFEFFFEIFHLPLPGSPCDFSVFGLCILTRYQVCPNLAKNPVFLPTFFDISGLVACKTYIFPAFAPKIMDTPDAVYKHKMRKVAETARFAGGERKNS
jgi:hypothetical protein